MNVNDPCSICGSKDLNLIDGYYYCVECGTQDTNVRETLIEDFRVLGDGQIAQITKRKIIGIKDAKVRMSGEWYKWNIFNFIICGLADELIALGAAPSFKTKLLWVWTRYVKKFQDKDNLGAVNNETNGASILQSTLNNSGDEECVAADVNKGDRKNKLLSKYQSSGIKTMSSGLLYGFLYVALNLDKSDVQISHLFRFIEEGKLDTTNFNRHIPKDVDVKAISGWEQFSRTCGQHVQSSKISCRCKAMKLFKVLDLGYPVLPDMKKIVSNFVTELCLPNDFKNLVFSLMHLWPCDYLELDHKNFNKLMMLPDYEGVAMSYIIVALKMVFGLDDQYEYRLSDIVDQINDKYMYLKCYKLGFTLESTGRLFSFRDWINYLQFRKKILVKYRLCSTKDQHYLDIDDYAYFENLAERPKGKVYLTDELSMNIINKIPFNDDISVISKSDLPHTLTPMTTYTEIIMNHCKDVESMQLLSEDFKQYSLKYACESLDLSDFEESRNIFSGVSDTKKIVKSKDLLCGYMKTIKMGREFKMIFIRNCENKNWRITKKPTIDHITYESSEYNNEGDSIPELESDNGYDSNLESSPSDKEALEEKSESVHLETIREEDKDINIFDDLFANLEIKDVAETQNDYDFDALEENIEMCNEQNEIGSDYDMEDNKSISSAESFEFNPETFNRERAIKDLIIRACKKYKIPIPKEYKSGDSRKRKFQQYEDEAPNQRKYVKTSERAESKQRINKLLEAYFHYVENDVINQVAKEVKSAIWQSNQSNQLEVPVDQINEFLHNSEHTVNSVIDDINVSKENHSSALLSETNSISKVECQEENPEPNLFEGESEGEVDDLIPKSDTRFDDNKYDASQLFVKMNTIDREETSINEEEIYASIKDPDIDEILERAIEGCKKRRNLGVNTGNESSDSEEDIPLNIIKEARDKQLKENKEEHFDLLIKRDRIQEFKYWVKRYHMQYLCRYYTLGVKFDTEIYENTPKTFSFLFRECANIYGGKQFSLYKCLQHLEYNMLKFTGIQIPNRRTKQS